MIKLYGNICKRCIDVRYYNNLIKINLENNVDLKFKKKIELTQKSVTYKVIEKIVLMKSFHLFLNSQYLL